MQKKNYTEQEITEAVKSSYSIAEVCRKIGLKPVGGNYKTVRLKIEKLKLDMSHFTGQAWSKGKQVTCNPGQPLSKIMVERSTYTNSNSLRNRILKEGLKESKCERCGRSKWLGLPIKLELHHKNGNNIDNRIENIQILCPNCHALTENYRGKNKDKSVQRETSEVEHRKFGEPLLGNANGNAEPSLN